VRRAPWLHNGCSCKEKEEKDKSLNSRRREEKERVKEGEDSSLTESESPSAVANAGKTIGTSTIGELAKNRQRVRQSSSGLLLISLLPL